MATDTLGVPVLKEEMKVIWVEQVKHVSCIQHPPGVQLYTVTGNMRKGWVIGFYEDIILYRHPGVNQTLRKSKGTRCTSHYCRDYSMVGCRERQTGNDGYCFAYRVDVGTLPI
jgi:hypothetical protein